MTALAPMRAKPAARHDCGRHGHLTAREIAAISGLSESTVRHRLCNGVRGDALTQRVRPSGNHSGNRKVHYTDSASTTGSLTIATALKIALAYANRTPTVEELQRRFGMSRATAYRWIRAFLDAKGEGALA